jgi:hypothetical protein
MKIDGLESDIVRKSRAYGIEVIADYIEANGEIGPDERKYIVEILRDKFPKKTGPKRQKDREKIEAEIVFEIIRTMYFWDITAYAARKKIVNFYPNLNEETMKSWWMKYQNHALNGKRLSCPTVARKL